MASTQGSQVCLGASEGSQCYEGGAVVLMAQQQASKGLLATLKGAGGALPSNYFMPAVCLGALAAVLALGSGAEVLTAPAAGPATPWTCCVGDACTDSPV